jgi:alpha/beta superfamily hydrolase
VSRVRRLWFEGPAGRLEALLRVACPARAAAVVAHPHPQYGGTMQNPVVFHVDRELHRAGLTTLRFNFRGVGASDGEHDNGVGEVEDVGAAVTWLRGVAVGLPLLLVGYSFGSRCALQWGREDPEVSALVAIGMPVRLYDFGDLERLTKPLAVVQGANDEFGPPEEVRPLVERAGGSLHVVEGASHLFPNQARDAAAAVVRAARDALRLT